MLVFLLLFSASTCHILRSLRPFSPMHPNTGKVSILCWNCNNNLARGPFLSSKQDHKTLDGFSQDLMWEISPKVILLWGEERDPPLPLPHWWDSHPCPWARPKPDSKGEMLMNTERAFVTSAELVFKLLLFFLLFILFAVAWLYVDFTIVFGMAFAHCPRNVLKWRIIS